MRFQLSVGLWSSFIMNNGSMVGITSDSIERDIAKQWLFCSQSCKLSVYRHFCLSPSFYSRLQPLQELHHRNAILQHSAAIALYLGIILYCLHIRNWRSLTYHIYIANSLEYRIACFLWVEQQTKAFILLNSRLHILIIINTNTMLTEILLHPILQLHLINI